MAFEPDEPLKMWGENPVVERQPDEIDDAIQIVEKNADLIEAKAVIRTLVEACRAATFLSISSETEQNEIAVQLWAAIHRAKPFTK